MNNKLSDMKFIINPSCSIRKPNKIFFENIHLFNCGCDGMMIFDGASTLQKKNGFFTINDLSVKMDFLGGFQVSKGETSQITLRTIEYLFACQLVQEKK